MFLADDTKFSNQNIMASEEDQDVFEITDFTTATDWERFIASIEEVIHEWKLPNAKSKAPLKKRAFSTGTWGAVDQEIMFADFRFVMTRHFLKTQGVEDICSEEPIQDNEDVVPDALTDMMATGNDFCSSPPVLSQWYGLREYMVISPSKGGEVIANESRAKLLLSSACVAINNTGCRIPIFVQMHQKSEHYYVGVCEGGGLRTNFQMVHLRKTPQYASHLTGLLDLFKSKLGCEFTTIPPVSVSICFTYALKDWDHSASWPQQPPDFDSLIPSVGASELSLLPFGTWEDPISEILLSTIWSRLTEDVVVDNSVCSDLDPNNSSLWRVKVDFAVDPACLLAEYLDEFRLLGNHHETTDQLLGIHRLSFDDENNLNITHALDRITSTSPYKLPSVASTVVSPLKRSHRSQIPEGPIPEEKLKEILFFLFPDAVGKANIGKASKSDESDKDTAGRNEDIKTTYSNVTETLNSLKSAPVNSLLYFLAICMCHVNHTFGRVPAVAHLWHEFVLEMRHRWENKLLIMGIDSGPPNLSTCLLHQKLQMLNYCIEKKKLREEQQQKEKIPGSSEGWSRIGIKGEIFSGGASSSEDEFFECNDDGSRNSAVFEDTVTHQPEGRLRPCNDLKLDGSNEILYIPITQEPAPMTEDQLEEHAEVLVQLGTDDEGVQLRAQMQSACLLSDMQAFKAANPGCCLEDFVHWYSPRDWIEEEEEDEFGNLSAMGHLSARMLVPGNVWQDAWQNAPPIPARRQKRLFDDTKEGEKVLHFLAAMRPSDIVLRLMPMLIHAAINTLLKNGEPSAPIVPNMLQTIASSAAKLTKAPLSTALHYKDIINRLNMAEMILSQCKALKNLFQHAAVLSESEDNSQNEFVKTLLEQREVYLPGGANTAPGKWMLSLFQESIKEDPDSVEFPLREEKSTQVSNFPAAVKREYILHSFVPHPAPYSRSAPQRMYAGLSNTDYRLAGAFTQDTIFQ